MSAIRSLMLILAVACATAAGDAGASCMPCLTKSALEKSVEQSSLIVAVTNNDQNCSASLTSGPAVVRLKVDRIFKGAIGDDTVDVHSWYGQCIFGVHLGLNERAILLLQEVNDIATGEWDGTFKLVEDGCSTGQLDIRGEQVYVNGRMLSLDSFASKYIR